jgi:hypothetical protein
MASIWRSGSARKPERAARLASGFALAAALATYRGYTVDSCLVDTGETAEEVTAGQIHARAPQAKICFNSSPADTAEAVKRWI